MHAIISLITSRRAAPRTLAHATCTRPENRDFVVCFGERKAWRSEKLCHQWAVKWEGWCGGGFRGACGRGDVTAPGDDHPFTRSRFLVRTCEHRFAVGIRLLGLSRKSSAVDLAVGMLKSRLLPISKSTRSYVVAMGGFDYGPCSGFPCVDPVRGSLACRKWLVRGIGQLAN
jgi:hypothetical protein